MPIPQAHPVPPAAGEVAASLHSPTGKLCCAEGASPIEAKESADDEREAAIRQAGEEVIAHMTEWRRSGCFAARGAADAANQRQRELILGRSPAQIARMEAVIEGLIRRSPGAEHA